MNWFRVYDNQYCRPPKLSPIELGDDAIGLAERILREGIEEWLERQAEQELYGPRYYREVLGQPRTKAVTDVLKHHKWDVYETVRTANF